jgi:hypothetical protein
MGSHDRVRGRNGGPGTRELVGEIGRQLVHLDQTEVELERAELASNGQSARRALVGLGVATVAALVGLTVVLVSALGFALVLPGWLAALIVAGVVLGVGTGAGYLAGNIAPARRWLSRGNR